LFIVHLGHVYPEGAIIGLGPMKIIGLFATSPYPIAKAMLQKAYKNNNGKILKDQILPLLEV
jgi:hypothetical protein